jgi:hypothetical protein
MPAQRFACTPGGAIARSRRRMRLLFAGLGGTLVAAALLAWAQGRLAAGILPLVVAGIVRTAWRMSGDLDVLELELADGRLTVRMRRQLRAVAVGGARARRLDPEERRHLERLASSAGITASTGGFDSSRLGEFDLHATDLENAVLVETEEERLVVTPDRCEEFLAALRAS